MNPWLVDAIGIAGALLTTFCWLPQVVKIVRERDTRAISFPANFACAVGVGCWLVYGAALSLADSASEAARDVSAAKVAAAAVPAPSRG